MKKYQQWQNFYTRMSRLGISEQDADSLRRIELTLHRWAERECNGEVERDEQTGKTVARIFRTNGPDRFYPVPDRETGAINRLKAIMARYPELWYYHQGDPRGCALYIGRLDSLRPGETLDSYYSSRGIPVCL